MKYIKGNEKIIKTNRGRVIHLEAHFAEKTPEGLFENLFEHLLRMGVFDGLPKSEKDISLD